MASVPRDLAPGTTVGGKYELLRKIGSGAMGEVWAARHATLHEEVAIKLVLRGVDNGDGSSAESRFLVEARVAASLSRKTRHIVAVTDHGQDGELGYLVMELLAGESLAERMARTGPLPLARVVPMVVQIARGLATAHAAGVVHRDLKPSNVFVTVDEEGHALAKVLDFGIAKLRLAGDRRAAFTTQKGFLLGTPAYMSPEQARGRVVDHRADVWALAVIAYHMLTGEFPFDADSADELFARIIRVTAIPIHDRAPELPAVVGDFFARAFAKRLEERFPSALALATALEQLGPLEQLEPRVAVAATRPELTTGSSMFVAGVPRKRRLGRGIAAGLSVGAVVALTGALLFIYFEREPTSRTPAAPGTGASLVRPVAPPERSPLVPLPLEEPSAIAAARATRPVARPPAASDAPAAAAPVVAAPITASVPVPSLRTAQRVDKSEIF